MPRSPAPSDLQAAVDAANAEIRAFMADVPGGRLSAADRAGYDRLVEVFMRAVGERDRGRGEWAA